MTVGRINSSVYYVLFLVFVSLFCTAASIRSPTDVTGGTGDISTVGLCTTGDCIADFIDNTDMADADHGDVSWSGGVATVDSGAVLLSELGDPGAAKTFAMGAHELTFGSATTGWGGVTISSSNAAIAGETALLTLSHADADDTNQTWFDFKDGGGTVLKMTGVAGGAQITAGAGGTTKIYASALDYDSIDNLTIGGVSLNDQVTPIPWETGVSVGTAGVLLTDDGDGAITFQGQGDGADENLTFNFDDYANEVYVTTGSGVLAINMPGIGLKAPLEVTAADADGETITTDMLNTVRISSGAGDWDLPADSCDAATGNWLMVIANAAHVASITSLDTSDVFVLTDGTALTANDELDTGGAAWDSCTVMCVAANTWLVIGERGTCADGGVP
jgi:hypothetical protein